jgi:hypothetical protein
MPCVEDCKCNNHGAKGREGSGARKGAGKGAGKGGAVVSKRRLKVMLSLSVKLSVTGVTSASKPFGHNHFDLQGTGKFSFWSAAGHFALPEGRTSEYVKCRTKRLSGPPSAQLGGHIVKNEPCKELFACVSILCQNR